MPSIKELMEAEKIAATCNADNGVKDFVTICAYQDLQSEQAAKLREMADMLPEIKKALLRANQGIPYPINKPGFMALKGKLEKWENG
ncbi:MAG: hypothetical protein V3V81_07490 [Candidatus Bathyarchaeia archaeon]